MTDTESLRKLRRSALVDNADPAQAVAANPTDAVSESGKEDPKTGGAVSTEAAVGGYQPFARQARRLFLSLN